MDQVKNFFVSRKDIVIRLLYTVFFSVVFEFLKIFQIFLAFIQFIWALITHKHIEPLRNFTDRLAVLSYQILRYISLNENRRPFPFSDFPEAMDSSDPVRFGEKE